VILLCTIGRWENTQ